jgi:hypothetical protein
MLREIPSEAELTSQKDHHGRHALRCVGAPRPPAARLQATVGDIFYLG